MLDKHIFHSDELAAQRLAGGGAGGGGIRDFMPDQHRAFFAGLRYVAMAAVGESGWPAATLLTGAPGFIQAPDAHTLVVAFGGPHDPTLQSLAPGQDVGLIGIDFATRRRNRANGIIAPIGAGGLRVTVRQSFGNCPRYIQRRTVQHVTRTPKPVETLATLDGDARALIAGADTLFVASHARRQAGELGGADISHRGGAPGFVTVDDATLKVPDYAGNRYFNTLGNFLGERRAALLFFDFYTGDLLHLQGEVEIDWTARPTLGAERTWRLHTLRAWRRRAAVPLRWSFIEASPFIPQLLPSVAVEPVGQGAAKARVTMG